MKENMMTECPICSSKELIEMYNGPIRSAEPGSPFTEGYKIDHCSNCSMIFLNPFPKAVLELYKDGDYWKARTDDLKKKEFVNKFIREQLIWLQKSGAEEYVNERVLDVGCGHGIFLDVIKNIAAKTAGMDVDIYLKPHLEAQGHEYFATWPDEDSEKFSRIVLFNTLEHIEDPVSFMKEAAKRLTDDGKVIVGVPNSDDFMVNVVKEYIPFFYRKGHLFYFSLESLRYVLEAAGYRTIQERFVHQYNLMNLIGWAKNRSPQGVPDSHFDDFTEETFIANLEREGKASHILITAEFDR